MALAIWALIAELDPLNQQDALEGGLATLSSRARLVAFVKVAILPIVLGVLVFILLLSQGIGASEFLVLLVLIPSAVTGFVAWRLRVLRR